jgi:hypothetical protein
MLPAPRINDVLHRVTFAAGWESPRSQVLGRLVLADVVLLLSGRRSDALKRAELDHLCTHTLKGP